MATGEKRSRIVTGGREQREQHYGSVVHRLRIGFAVVLRFFFGDRGSRGNTVVFDGCSPVVLIGFTCPAMNSRDR